MSAPVSKSQISRKIWGKHQNSQHKRLVYLGDLRCRSGSYENPASPGARIGRSRRGEAIYGVDPTSAWDFGVSNTQHLVVFTKIK